MRLRLGLLQLGVELRLRRRWYWPGVFDEVQVRLVAFRSGADASSLPGTRDIGVADTVDAIVLG